MKANLFSAICRKRPGICEITIQPWRTVFESAYDTFEFLARNPGVGRPRPGFGFENLRSWHVFGFRRFLIFYRQLPDRIQIWRVLHGSRNLESVLLP